MDSIYVDTDTAGWLLADALTIIWWLNQLTALLMVHIALLAAGLFC